MRDEIKITNSEYLKKLVLFFPVILYSPLYFYSFFPEVTRVTLFAIMCVFLFFSSLRVTTKDVAILILLSTLSLIAITGNENDTIQLKHFAGYLLLMLFGWSLHRYLLGSKKRVEVLINLYCKFFYLAVICSVLSLLYFYIVGDIELLGDRVKLKFYSTPFGIIFLKNFFGLQLPRSVFFFHEAVHAGIFYAANIVIVSPLLKHKSRGFALVNLIGGILTISLTFYVLLFAFFLFNKKITFRKIINVLILFLAIYFAIQISELYLYSSYGDRFFRLEQFLIEMNQATSSQLFFGHGIKSYSGAEGCQTTCRAFNSGITIAIYELGLIIFVLQLILLFVFTRFNRLLILFFFIAALVLDPIKMPLFWFFLLLFSEKISNDKVIFNQQIS